MKEKSGYTGLSITEDVLVITVDDVIVTGGYSEPTEPPIPLEESRPLRKIEPLIPI